LNILAVDTTTETLGIAVALDNGKSVWMAHNIGYRHGELLEPLIDRLLTDVNIRPKDLTLIVCAYGPGSFTGLRIGIATCKGLSFGIGCPLVFVSTLDAIGYGFGFFNGFVVPVIDARKERFYGAIYEKGTRIVDYFDLSKPDITTRVNDLQNIRDSALLVSGSAGMVVYESLKPAFDGKSIALDPCCDRFNPALLLRLGEKKYRENPSLNLDTEGPLYLRKSEAELGIRIDSGTGKQ
jgi:tRNA threonylcarbamoyladenosine biosynthesis protein TsaB